MNRYSLLAYECVFVAVLLRVEYDTYRLFLWVISWWFGDYHLIIQNSRFIYMDQSVIA